MKQGTPFFSFFHTFVVYSSLTKFSVVKKIINHLEKEGKIIRQFCVFLDKSVWNLICCHATFQGDVAERQRKRSLCWPRDVN